MIKILDIVHFALEAVVFLMVIIIVVSTFSALNKLDEVFKSLSSNVVTNQSELSQKIQECITAKGDVIVHDSSLYDDGSEYKASCTLPSRDLWEIDLSNPQS